jgi:hypothetical protein
MFIIVPNTLMFIVVPHRVMFIILPHTLMFIVVPHTVMFIIVPHRVMLIILPHTVMFIVVPHTVTFIIVPHTVMFIVVPHNPQTVSLPTFRNFLPLNSMHYTLFYSSRLCSFLCEWSFLDLCLCVAKKLALFSFSEAWAWIAPVLNYRMFLQKKIRNLKARVHLPLRISETIYSHTHFILRSEFHQ